MADKAVHSWTLAGLLVAFLDLAIAYFLLCVSAFVFFPSKFLSLLELYLPCTCGFRRDLCWHNFLIDWPRRNIISVLQLVKSRFPFELIWHEDYSCNSQLEGDRDGKCANGVMELEGEASSSSGLQNFVDRESGYDAKGKKIMNQKQRSGTRRRRRTALACARFPSVSSSNGMRYTGKSVLPSAYDDNETRTEISECLGPGSGVEDSVLDQGSASNCIYLDESIQHGIDLNRSCDKGKCIATDASSVPQAEERPSILGNDADVIRMLEQALKEEKAARAALYQELEEERAAAATAADEAMAMILRLQEDKASIVMEAKQYRRMIEEKFVYDEEEMNILKEILVRREREIHFLENEVGAYRQTNFSGDEALEDDDLTASLSIDSPESPLLVLQQIRNIKSNGEKDLGTNASWSSHDEQSHTLAFGNNMTSNHEESAAELSISEVVPQKTDTLAKKETAQTDLDMMPKEISINQACDGTGEEMDKDSEHWTQGVDNMHSSTQELESTFYDVHVIDDKTVLIEDKGKENGALHGAASDSGFCGDKLLSNGLDMAAAETEPKVHGSGVDMHGRLIVSSSPECETLGIDSQRSSSSAISDERLKIDTEVESLRERLRSVQGEKERLSFPAEHRERVNVQLKLVEEIIEQLREIKQLGEPVRHASLPPSSSKVRNKQDLTIPPSRKH